MTPAVQKTASPQERRRSHEADVYYREAANGQAQIVYFAGWQVAAAISVVAGVWLAFAGHRVAALIAGAVGGVVSVIQRINTGEFALDYDVGRPYTFFLGGLRPLIGGAFGIVISFALTAASSTFRSRAPTTQHRLALVVVAFLAGFSERWAQDTLATTLPASVSK